MKQDGARVSIIPSPYGLCLGEFDAVRRGSKKTNHSINHQHNV